MSAAERWEVGSLFHTVAVPPGAAPGGSPEASGGASGGDAPWTAGPHALVGSGRDALRLLWRHRRPGRVWVPSYLCQEVVASVVETARETRVYPDGPLDHAEGPEPWDQLRPGDAVLTVAYFGVRRPRRVPVGVGVSRDEILVVEDHTHGPAGTWARASDADYCFASLRKLWPLADGGVLWSPAGHGVPDTPPTLPELERASGIKLAGMELKARYLRGEAVPKPLFRTLLDRGEKALYGTEPSGITSWSRAVAESLPLEALEEARRSRFRTLVSGLSEHSGVRVLTPPAHGEGPAPFSALFVFDEAGARDRVHGALVEERVFASRLWPLDEPAVAGVRDADVALSRRSFSVPVDMRYEEEDMERVAGIIDDALGRLL